MAAGFKEGREPPWRLSGTWRRQERVAAPDDPG
jgi:hypothetical protein